ncbi:hypothetical protein CDD81_5315 [Ophiocordyceps australis]|uniref:INO80 complex subunit Ies4 n=1 Tax=Ophiocordyceps australis TaxID=1399860 RepID=A0A2C5YH71_9HYPO|nr:hypothetical protein CDD81_5315 [Ophiocordyceps australis]
MPPSSKITEGRRKSAGKPTLLITLSLAPPKLRSLLLPQSTDEESPVKESASSKDDSKASPANSATPAPQSNSNSGENASDSNAATPAAEGTPVSSAMGPPADGPKKKGIKRSAATANGTGEGGSKPPRGKPGPKKKPRLEDGTIDHSTNRPAGGHKLGPKANQGAINAGLRALDRSGKPCRKWSRGGFCLKSFTGVQWEIPRWKAPPKKSLEPNMNDSAVPSAENSSSKENKENRPDANSASNSNSGADMEMRSVLSVNASSPAPMAVGPAPITA